VIFCAENRKAQMQALQLFEEGKLGLGEMGTGMFPQRWKDRILPLGKY